MEESCIRQQYKKKDKGAENYQGYYFLTQYNFAKTTTYLFHASPLSACTFSDGTSILPFDTSGKHLPFCRCLLKQGTWAQALGEPHARGDTAIPEMRAVQYKGNKATESINGRGKEREVGRCK